MWRCCTVTGLTNGTAYTFTVVATNGSDDSSDPSDPSPAVTPFASPDAPKTVTGRPGDRQVVVSWTAPANAGTGGITGYRVTASPAYHCGVDTVTACAAAARIRPGCTTHGATSCTVVELADGTAYRFTVVAVNAYADSPVSAPSDLVTPAEVDALPLPDAVPTGGSTLRNSAGRRFSHAERTTTLIGTGFAANSPVTVGIYSSPRKLTTAVTNCAGAFRVRVIVPTGYTGTHASSRSDTPLVCASAR